MRLQLLVVALAASGAQARPVELHLELFNEAAAVPFTTLAGRHVNPGGLVAAGWRWSEWSRASLVQRVSVLGFSHTGMQWGLGVVTEAGLRGAIWALVPEVSLGLGYLHVLSGTAHFAKDATGRYVQVADWGAPRLGLSISAVLAFDAARISTVPLALFVKYGSLLEVMDVNGSVLPHLELAVGCRYTFDWGAP